MLHVQQYLQTKSLDDLTAELAIKQTHHPDGLPLVILNYDQINSSKLHPVVRECRGLVLEVGSWKTVALSFSRFFNWGEVQEEMKDFDFSDFSVQSKEDGSLVLVYWYDGKWRANTRGSFAQDNMQFQNFTWEEGICKAAGKSLEQLGACLDKDDTYVFEFVSPWNKVVRRYEQPALYLLTAFKRDTAEELSIRFCDAIAAGTGLLRPTRYNFCNIEEIQQFLQDKAASDATFEGVVIRDKHGHRWKIKSSTYLGLHKLKGNDDVWNPKHLLPFVLNGETDELLAYFPEVARTFFELKSAVLEAYVKLLETWAEHQQIPDQKGFALMVKDMPFASILFDVRKKYGQNQTPAHLRQAWRDSGDRILKFLQQNCRSAS